MKRNILVFFCLLLVMRVYAEPEIGFLPMESQLIINVDKGDTLYHVKDGSVILFDKTLHHIAPSKIRITTWGSCATEKKPAVITYRIPDGILEPGSYRVAIRLDVIRFNPMHLKVFINKAEIADKLFPESIGTQKIYTVTKEFDYRGGKLELNMQSLGVGKKGDRLRLHRLAIVPQFNRSSDATAKHHVLSRGGKSWEFTAQGALAKIHDARQAKRDFLSGKGCIRPPFQLEYRSESKPDAAPLVVTGVEEQENRLAFNYRIGDDIRVRTVADIRENGDLNWRINVDNRSKLEIIGVRFPIVSNLEIDDAEDDILYYPKSLGLRIMNPKANLVRRGKIYGHNISMNYMLLADEQRGGFYLGGHDPKLIDNALEYSMFYGSPLLFMKNMVSVRPGESYSSAPFRLATYLGSWHNGAKIYREFVRSWMRPVPYPSWARVPAAPMMRNRWISTIIAGHKTKLITKFTELVGYYESILRDYSTPVIWVQGQMVRGGCYRYYHLNPDAGTEQEYRDAIREIKAKGGVVCNYTNGMNWDLHFPENLPECYRGRVNTKVPGIHDWKQFTQDNKVVDVHGEDLIQYTGKGNWNFRIMCPNAKGWRNYLNYWIVDKYARDYGVNAMQLDQVGCTQFGLGTCFATEKHGHRHHGEILIGYRKMLSEILTNARKVNPDFWTFPEGVCDAYNDVTCFMGWNGYHDGEDKDIRYPVKIHYPEMIRYTLPEVALRGNPLAKNREFVLGISSNFSRLQDREIYRRIADWYACAEYCHDEGLKIGNPELEASVMRNVKDHALIVIVHSQKPYKGKLNIRLSEDTYPELASYSQMFSYRVKSLPNGIRKSDEPTKNPKASEAFQYEKGENHNTFAVLEKPCALISKDGEFTLNDELDMKERDNVAYVFSAEHAEQIVIHIPQNAKLNKAFTIGVTDQRGEPLPGVNVQMGDQHQISNAKGETVWRVTEFTGDYYVRADMKGKIFNNGYVHVAK